MYELVLATEATKCEFCNKAKSTDEVVSRLDDYPEPEIGSLVCDPCLRELQLGHVLKDIYGWSWTRFEGEFVAECVEPELEPEEVVDVPF